MARRRVRNSTTAAALAPAAPATPTPFRWVVLAGVWLVYATFGMATVSLAPLVAPIGRDLGVSHAMMGFVFGAWQAVFIVSAVPGMSRRPSSDTRPTPAR